MCTPLTTRTLEETGFWIWEGGAFTFYPTNPWRGPSHTFTCPKCGIVWAKAHSGFPEHGWQPYSMICENCPGWITRPAGSLYIDWHEEYTAIFSRELLTRELRIEIAYANTF